MEVKEGYVQMLIDYLVSNIKEQEEKNSKLETQLNYYKPSEEFSYFKTGDKVNMSSKITKVSGVHFVRIGNNFEPWYDLEDYPNTSFDYEHMGEKVE
jgi:hypothetical protein